ncbi:uncharacterized protein FOMMEDRAFT_91593, partial [Fomitiporia mediterranea MF3/22]|uniref:uncharacterized protein n=1 Tax=Fomitiporia mediterranea (strain MF3/22) TaxID=694068 RepID=UPI00044080BC
FLKKESLALYNRLNKGTVQKWIALCRTKWSDTTIYNVQNKCILGGSGRVGTLTKYPELVEEIKTNFLGFCAKGYPLNAVIGCSIMLAIIKACNPDILTSNFQYSEKYIRLFLGLVLNMTVRRATRAAAHLPKNWEEVCECAFFRLVHVVKEFDIPSLVSASVLWFIKYITHFLSS